jgi:hypothetical protein
MHCNGWHEFRRLARARRPRVRFAKTLSTSFVREFPIHISNSRRTNAKAPPPLFSQGAGSAGHFHPLGSRGEVSLTNVRERSAERRWCGTPHPVARPYDRAGPSSGRELPVRDADRRASRRSTAAFSFDLETAFWKRTGAAIRNALDSAGFHPRSSAPTSPLPDGPT